MKEIAELLVRNRRVRPAFDVSPMCNVNFAEKLSLFEIQNSVASFVLSGDGIGL